MGYSYLLLFVTFVLAIAVIYLSILMVRKWYVTFSPKEVAFFGIIMFSVGWTLSSYLLGNAMQIMEGSAVIIILFILFVYRWNQRRSLRKARMGADQA